jgi:hypothetical protein
MSERLQSAKSHGSIFSSLLLSYSRRMETTKPRLGKQRLLLLAARTLIMGYVISAWAGTADISAVPVPKMTPAQVLAIAEPRIQSRPQCSTCSVVEVAWAKNSSFQARISSGTQWHVLSDPADDYSWFVTFVFRDEEMAKLMGTAPGRINESVTIRIKDDGKDGTLIGTR